MDVCTEASDDKVAALILAIRFCYKPLNTKAKGPDVHRRSKTLYGPPWNNCPFCPLFRKAPLEYLPSILLHIMT